jgi:hypothetical protein
VLETDACEKRFWCDLEPRKATSSLMALSPVHLRLSIYVEYMAILMAVENGDTTCSMINSSLKLIMKV